MTAKIAIFVEGQTELIFVESLLYNLFTHKSITVELKKKYNKFINFTVNSTQGLDIICTVVNVGGDEKVLSAIQENIEKLRVNGYKKVIGLRDLYPNERNKMSNVIASVEKHISKKVLNNLTDIKVKLCLAIMETEAWFLADHNLFEKIDPRLTVEFIKQEKNYDLLKDDPEKVYDHPAKVIGKIYSLVDLEYKKKKGQVSDIAKKINYDDLLYGNLNGKISSFLSFINEIEDGLCLSN